MRFEHPPILWFVLLAVPALTAFFWWSWRRRRALIAQFVQSRLLAQLTVGVSPRRQKARLALLVLGVALLLLALARPQWGYDWEEARQRGLDIVVAIDTSKSMLAEDARPNRLERAKLAALDLKRLARTDRLGLVAFAGSAFLQCPLTLDDEAFRQSVAALDTQIIPQGGSALAEAVQCALGAFKEKSDNHRILILFTDGEDHDSGVLDAAKAAAKEGLTLFTIGVGTPNGELIRLTDAKGRSDFLKDDQGNVVKSRLNETLLRQLAQAANGVYLPLSGADTMELLYERRLAPLPKAEFSSQRVRRWHERFQWFLGLALVLLLAEMFLPERRLVRRTEAMAAAANEELRKAVAALLLLALPCAALASPAAAKKKYERGRYDSALFEYQKLLKETPGDPRLHFNAGDAAYQAKDYEESRKHFNAALHSPDIALQQRAYYNLGNTHYRLGEDEEDPQQKRAAWQEATNHFDTALKLNPADADARYNLDLVTAKLAALPPPPPSPSGGDDKGKQDDQKKDQQSQSRQNQSQQDQQKQSGQDQQKQDTAQQQARNDQAPPRQEKDPPDDKQDGQAAPAALARMTPKEAQQLLDTVKGEERAMIFQPPPKTNRTERVFKDW
jgi:Ca-activated chloride channel family protein